MSINEEAVNVVQNGSVPMLRAQAVRIVHNLSVDGLLAPSPQIIRTVEELEALDPDTVVWPARHYGPYPAGTIVPDPLDPYWIPPLPAVVIRDGAGVRAAREALEEA